MVPTKRNARTAPMTGGSHTCHGRDESGAGAVSKRDSGIDSECLRGKSTIVPISIQEGVRGSRRGHFLWDLLFLLFFFSFRRKNAKLDLQHTFNHAPAIHESETADRHPPTPKSPPSSVAPSRAQREMPKPVYILLAGSVPTLLETQLQFSVSLLVATESRATRQMRNAPNSTEL